VEGDDFASFVFDVGLPISINMYYTTSVFFLCLLCWASSELADPTSLSSCFFLLWNWFTTYVWL